MKHAFGEQFVRLRDGRLRAHRRTELTFHHPEHRLHIAPSVVVVVEVRAMHHEVRVHLAEQQRAVSRRIDLERDVGRRADGVDCFDVVTGEVRLVGRDLLHVEVFRSRREEWREHRAVASRCHVARRDDVSARADHGVKLDPQLCRFFDVLLVEPTGSVHRRAEPCRVDRELRVHLFQLLERKRTLLDERLQDRRDRRIFECAEHGGGGDRLIDKAVLLARLEIRLCAFPRDRRVDLVNAREDLVAEQLARATHLLRRLLNTVAQRLEELLDALFLVLARFVIGRPVPWGVLPLLLDRQRLRHRPVRVHGALQNQRPLDGVLVFALHATRLVVRARTLLVDEVDEVTADIPTARLRRYDVATPDLSDATVKRDDLAPRFASRLSIVEPSDLARR